MQRLKDGLTIENGLLDEIRAAFPAEFVAAVEIVRYVNTQVDVDLPLDEAAFIALHLNAARTGSSVKRPLQEANELSQLAESITKEFGISELSPSSNQELLSYLLRLIDRMSAQRSRHNRARTEIAHALPREIAVARRITQKIASTHHASASDDEAALLAVFLHGWLQGEGTPHER